jgi:hypothetical protein
MHNQFRNHDSVFLEGIAKKLYYIVKDGAVEEALLEKKLFYLLTEDISEEELKGLDERAVEASKDVDDLLGILPEQMADTIAHFKELQEKLPSPGEVASIQIAGNEKKASEEITKIVATVDEINTVKKSFLDAVGLLRNQLADLDFSAELQDAAEDSDLYALYAEKPLKDLAMYAKDNEKDFPSPEDLETGIKRSYKDPPKKKGFLDKMLGFFGFGDDAAPELREIYAQELLEKVPFKNFVDFTIESTAMQGDAQADVEQDAGPTADIAADLQAMQPAARGSDGDMPAPAPEAEADKEQERTEEEIRSAAEEEAAQITSPTDAALGAIQGWYDGLSSSSKQTLDAADRIGGLKTGIKAGLEGAADAVGQEVAKAIKQWRSEHEETLIKSRRFAKKNFDTLEELIPQLAATMVKKANEAAGDLTCANVHRAVYKFLNKRFQNELQAGMLHEVLLSQRNADSFEELSYSKADLIKARWLRIAGLEENNDGYTD